MSNTETSQQILFGSILSEPKNLCTDSFVLKRLEKAAENLFNAGGFSKKLLEHATFNALWEGMHSVLSSGVNGILTPDTDPCLYYTLENDIYMFSGFKSLQMLQEAGRLLLSTKSKIKSFEEFIPYVLKIHEKYNNPHLYIEHNHTLSATQIAVKWSEWKKDGDKFNLQYCTAYDGKGSDEHAPLEEITLPPSDPFWDKYLPPNGWKCRCTAIQVDQKRYPKTNPAIAMELGDRISKENKQQIFRYNSGKVKKIFPPKHPYFKTPPELRRIIWFKNIKRMRALIRLQCKDNPLKEEIQIKMVDSISGMISIGNASIRDVTGHTLHTEVIIVLLDIKRIFENMKYIGWADVDPGKHKDVDFFTYYSITIEGKRYYANMKYFVRNNKEILYCITNRCNAKTIKKGKPNKKKITTNKQLPRHISGTECS